MNLTAKTTKNGNKLVKRMTNQHHTTTSPERVKASQQI
jgi:hypothetical protein